MASPTYDVRANEAASEANVAQFNVDRTHRRRWMITFSNPPITEENPDDAAAPINRFLAV